MDWIECRISHVLVDENDDAYSVRVAECDGDRSLTIDIGPIEASAIRQGVTGSHLQRPLTHDLLATLLTTLEKPLHTVRIHKEIDGVYFAELVIPDSNTEHIIDCRPSDALALLSRCENDVTLLIAEHILND